MPIGDPDDDIGAERRLALQYAAPDRRHDLALPWQLDARLRRVWTAAREPMIAEIKLAWWQERLDALRDGDVPPEPLLRHLAGAAAIDTRNLVRMAKGWRALFADELSADTLREHAELRGGGLVCAAASALGGETVTPMLLAGEGYALVDLATTRADEAERRALFAAARDRFEHAGRIVWPRPLRPLGMIVELARGDALHGVPGSPGSPARVARMAWHKLSGR